MFSFHMALVDFQYGNWLICEKMNPRKWDAYFPPFSMSENIVSISLVMLSTSGSFSPPPVPLVGIRIPVPTDTPSFQTEVVLLPEIIFTPLFPTDMLPDPLFIKTFPSASTDTFPLSLHTETPELEICTHPILSSGTLLPLESPPRGLEGEQEARETRRKDKKIYFIGKITLKNR